jgi:cytochrome c peroxidase
MHSDMPDVIMKLRSLEVYRDLFKKAFGSEGIDPDRMAEAIASFERSIPANPSRFDLFIKGDKNALTDLELKGLHVFRTKAGCMNCHHGPLFSDNLFHGIGFAFDRDDLGLYKVTHKEEDKGKFKTPSLRNVTFTGPWLHDGSFDDLGFLISMYEKGALSNEPHLFKNFSLSEEAPLRAFLKAISAPPAKFEKPLIP